MLNLRRKAIRTRYLTLAALILLFLFLWGAQHWADEYQVRLLNNVAIFITLAVAYNLINGICGQLHLGPTPSSPWGPTPRRS